MRFPARVRGRSLRCLKTRGTLAIIFMLVLFPSCNAPEGVAKFCSSAVTTLKTGDAIFDDMKASCIREAETRDPFGAFPLSDATPAVCEETGKKAEGLKDVSKIVSRYYTALNDLASFGSAKSGGDSAKAKSGDDSKSPASNISAKAKLTDARSKALESVVGFLTKIATSGYQQKHLADDITRTHDDIRAVLEGLSEAASDVYIQQLDDEEHKTLTRYKAFLLEHPNDAGALLTLDSRWQADRAGFEVKRKAARAYRAALEAMAKGEDDLAAHAHGLSEKDLSGLLSPYSAEMQSLTPTIQKAFI